MEVLRVGAGYFVPGLGIVVLPERLYRHGNGWQFDRTVNKVRTSVRFSDRDYGGTISSLRKAVDFTMAFYETPIDEARDLQVELLTEKLKPTGVVGVYSRTGLNTQYVVHCLGVKAVLEYSKKDTFTQAIAKRNEAVRKHSFNWTRLCEVLGLA